MEDVDYHFENMRDSTHNQIIHWNNEWKNRIFIFLGGLNDDYKNIRSQILNGGWLTSIEEVYSKLEAKEQ